jgi:exodeoxyribonuclease-3
MNLSIATWNVNGIRARKDTFLDWLKVNSPDILCLQEIKCVNDDFPSQEIEEFGYKCYVNGQKSFNGVAILSKYELTKITFNLDEDKIDEQARFIEATLELANNYNIIINCIYLPNGNPYPSEKFDYKLRWMDQLICRAKENISKEIPYIILGDFNIIPTEKDVYDYTRWTEDALFRIESKKKYRELCNLGLYDAHEFMNKGNVDFTHWDYQGGAWEKNHGIRIDHILLSASACSIICKFNTDSETRSLEKPSDHVPVLVNFDINQA